MKVPLEINQLENLAITLKFRVYINDPSKNPIVLHCTKVDDRYCCCFRRICIVLIFVYALIIFF